MGKSELSVLSRQCFNRRIDSQQIMTREIATWETKRNAECITINGR